MTRFQATYLMKDEIAQKLFDLNQNFYNQFASAFDRSRNVQMHGFHAALPHFPSGPLDVLDAGCGNGRFAKFMLDFAELKSYTGIDFSEGLLDQAKANYGHLSDSISYQQVDLRNSRFLEGYSQFDLITHHAVMHHIPQRKRRQAILSELASHLKPNGMLMLSTWQFATNARQKRKITDWSNINLTADDVEPGDYLLTWNRAGFGYRYCCMVDVAQTAELAQNAGLKIVKQYLEDGKERDLSLYTLLVHG